MDWCCQRAMHLVLPGKPAPDSMAITAILVFLWTLWTLRDKPGEAGKRCCRQAPRHSPSHRSACLTGDVGDVFPFFTQKTVFMHPDMGSCIEKVRGSTPQAHHLFMSYTCSQTHYAQMDPSWHIWRDYHDNLVEGECRLL